MILLIFTEAEKICLADLRQELQERSDKPRLYVVVNYKQIEVADSESGTPTYFDPDSSITLESLEALKQFVQENQRWKFERYLADEDQLDDFSWDDVQDDDFYDEFFDAFATNELGFYKAYYELIPVDSATFFTRKRAEVYLEEQKHHFHENAHVEERMIPSGTETAQLLTLLYRMANEAA